MSPQRVADAANVSPYPFVAQPGRAEASSAPEAAERGPHAKGKKAKARPPRAERSPRQEEDPKFNTGPRNLRTAPGNRGRRVFRLPGRAYPEDQNGIPDYPPPSFLEAINTPPLSVCSSTTSLVPTPATNIPLVFPEVVLDNIPEDPQSTEDLVAQAVAPNEGVLAENNDGSDSDDSMCIIDMNSVPVCSDDLPRGRSKSKSDWLLRRGGDSRSNADSSTKGNEAVVSKPIKPPRLEIDPNPTREEKERLHSPVTSPKRRFLSLSPLRTMFPAKSPVHHDRAMSAHPSPSPSPYAVSRATFFRSSSSLATSFLPAIPSLSNNKSENLTRKIFSHKSKDRTKAPHEPVTSPEDLNNWELLNEEAYAGVDKQGIEHPPSLTTAMASLGSVDTLGASPTRSQSFTFGANTPNPNRPRPQFRQSSETIPETSDLSLRDWKGPSPAFIDRTVNRRSPISPSTTTLLSNFSGSSTLPSAAMSMSSLSLPLTPVRGTPSSSMSASILSPKRTVHSVSHPSPLRVDAKPNLTINNQSTIATVIWQKALETPLPVTPVYHTHFDYGNAGSALVGAGDNENSPVLPAASAPVRVTPNLLTDSSSDRQLPYPSTQIPALHISVHPPPIPSQDSPTPVVKTSSLEEPMTPTRHHYAGRPLPRPPPTVNRAGIVDSTYAAPETSELQGGDKHGRSYNSCPEGLLIDLEDTTLDYSSASGPSTPRSEDGRGFPSQYHLPMMSPTASSVDLAGDTSSIAFDSVQGYSTPLRSPSRGPNYASQQSTGFSELTDLDLLVSRLTDGEHDGSDYETLLLVSELIGPATPQVLTTALQQEVSTDPIFRMDSPSVNMSLIGRIEVTRRRKTEDGRVKLKIKLLDITVDKCGICLSQFKDGEMAVLTSICQHAFHEVCAARWLARAKSCPLCRVPLDTDVR